MKPIILSTPEVRAILDGRKTQARKVIKLQPVLDDDGFWQWNGDVQWKHGGLGCPQSAIDDYAPYKPGDILYVRETWVKSNGDIVPEGFYYRANSKDAVIVSRWKSSATMPREAARLFLEVKSVRVERLRDISEEDAEAEGALAISPFDLQKIPNTLFEPGGAYGKGYIPQKSYRAGFYKIWEEANAKRGYGWDSNPWVWVIEFERRDKPECIESEQRSKQ